MSDIQPAKRAEISVWNSGKNKFLARPLLYLVLIFGAVLMVTPFVWMVSTSLKGEGRYSNIRLKSFPTLFTMIITNRLGQLFRSGSLI